MEMRSITRVVQVGSLQRCTPRPFTATRTSSKIAFKSCSTARCSAGKHEGEVQHSNINTATATTPASSRRSALLASLVAAPLAFMTPSPAVADSDGGSNRVFFDISVDGQPFGRIVVEVSLKDSPLGGQRFLDLAGKRGKEGVSFRRTKIELIENCYIQASGLKTLSYTASGRTGITGGESTELLEEELDRSKLRHDGPGVVSLVVRSSKKREFKEKLVAVKGKFVTVTEVLGDLPNGSAFAISTREEPELDKTNLVVGRVVEGQDVVDALAALPKVKNNANSPFFKAGKALGDKRANVGERAFGKPFNKIVIAECGPL